MRRVASVSVLVLAALAPLPAAAQSYAVDRGSLQLGGSAAFTSTGSSVNDEDGDDRITQIAIGPEVQYFVAPGLALGGEAVFSRISFDGEAVTNFGIGPAATYYFGRGPRSVYPYVGGSLLFVWVSDDTSDDEPTTRSWRGAGGVLVMLSGAVGLNVEAFYQQAKRDSDVIEFETDTFGMAVGFSAFIF